MDGQHVFDLEERYDLTGLTDRELVVLAYARANDAAENTRQILAIMEQLGQAVNTMASNPMIGAMLGPSFAGVKL